MEEIIHTLYFGPDGLMLSIIRPAFDSSVFFSVLAVVVLLFCTALFSGSEVAFFSLSPKQLSELRKQKSASNTSILKLLSDPKKLLATLLIANNFANIAIIIISSLAIHALFDFTHYPEMDFVFEVVAVSILIVLFGEVMPKVYATRKTMFLAHFMAIPLSILNKIASPLSSILVYSTAFIDNRKKKTGYPISVDELTHAIDITADPNLPEDEKKILKGIAKFGNIDAKQIMKSRTEVVAFEYKTNYLELLGRIKESGYSRVPVFEGNFDKVVGILYIKDLLAYHDEDDKFKWQSLLRQPFFVPESKKINNLLREFQRRKNHMAIVVDEYGGSSGLVTLEDILEEIVGDINDEFDDDELVYSKLDDHTFIFEGKALLNDIVRIMEIERNVLDNGTPETDTLAGFILELAGKIPKKGEEIEFRKIRFSIESVDRRRIHRVKISLPPSEIQEEKKIKN